MNKETVVIFVEVFLGPTMTFIRNQITDLRNNYNVVIIANQLNNSHLFNDNVIVVPHTLFSRILSFLGKKTGLYYTVAPLLMRKVIYNLAEKHDIACVISHFGTAGLQIGRIVESLSIPHSIIIHGWDGSSLLRSKAYRNQFLALRRSKLLFVSKSMRDNFSEYGLLNKENGVVNLGVPIDISAVGTRPKLSALYKSGGEILFFQAANFVPKKGHIYTLKAFAVFQSVYKNSKLLLAGDGPLKGDLLAQIKRLSLEDRVIILGHLPQDEVIKLFSEVHVFLHHSVTSSDGDQESIPTVIMEAMLHGLPVVSTTHSGIPELIESGFNGILVPERNISEYVEAMRQLCENEMRIGLNANNTIIEHFNLTKNLNKILSFTLE
jgi:colanic acid/amylovoran biosynthesis glycosyltransferase